MIPINFAQFSGLTTAELREGGGKRGLGLLDYKGANRPSVGGMRPNIICSLLSFGGGIVLLIVASEVRDHEVYFWVAAIACFVAAFAIWVAPWVWSLFRPNSAQVAAPREQRTATIKDWKTPVEAIETFGNESIRNERDRQEQEAAKIRADASEAELAIRKIYESYPTGGVSPPRAPADAFAHDAAKQAASKAAYQLLRQILQQLAQGKLVAKGFRLPYNGLGEVEIQQSDWRILELDQTNGTASHSGTPIFTGILIGKPKNRISQVGHNRPRKEPVRVVPNHRRGAAICRRRGDR